MSRTTSRGAATGIFAADALLALKAAVGLPVLLQCAA